MIYKFDIDNIEEQITNYKRERALGSLSFDPATGQIRVMTNNNEWRYID